MIEEPQLPGQGPRKGSCGCGCGVFGTLRKRPWRSNDVTCVARGCVCKQCLGKRSKTMGGVSQRRGKKELGISSTSSLHTGHEENDSEPWENKREKALTGPVYTAWEKVERQYEANRPIGRGPLLYFRAEHPIRRFSLIVIRGDRLYDAWFRLGVNKGWLNGGGRAA